MGRIAQGWKLKPDPRTGILSVRFTHAGKRYDRSTGARDPSEASREAARIYSDVIAGKDSTRAVHGKLPLRELLSAYLVDIDGTVSKHTHAGYEYCAFSKVKPFFLDVDAFTTANIGAYVRHRLREVTRETVQCDFRVIRGFLAWCADNGVIASVPVIPKLPRSPGTRALNRKESPVPITDTEARAIIAGLPERTRRGGIIVRARFALQWETSLRQATIGRLRVPEHYRRGSDRLVITDAIDKARFGRELPLTDAARAALDSVLPDVGLIFGATQCETFLPYLRASARLAGLPEDRARAFSAYDLRHGRITDLLGRGAPLPAVAYLAGHTLLTTTNRYVHVAGAVSLASRALQSIGGVSGGERRDTSENTSDLTPTGTRLWGDDDTM